MQQPRNIAAVADPVRRLMIGVVCGSVTKVRATRSKLVVATRTLQPLQFTVPTRLVERQLVGADLPVGRRSCNGEF